MDRPVIVIFAETTHNLNERFSPLVAEVRCHYQDPVLIGYFAGFELGDQRVKDSGLFQKTLFYATAEEAAAQIQDVRHDHALTFINHNFTHRDHSLFSAARKCIPHSRFILRNRINLERCLTSGIDDREMISKGVDAAQRMKRKISVIAQGLALLSGVILLFGKLYYSLFAPKRPEKRRILFIKLDVLGDMIVTIPYIAALRRHMHDAELTVMASSRGAGILQEQHILHPEGLYDHLLVWDAPWHTKFPNILGLEDLWKLVALLPRLWRERFDIAIQPVNFGTGIVLAVLSLAKRVHAVIDPRLPLAVSMSRFVSDPVPVKWDKMYHLSDWTKLVFDPLGINIVSIHPGLMVCESGRQRTAEELELHGYVPGQKIIVFNVGAGHPIRVWRPDLYAELIRRVHELYAPFMVLTGSRKERTLGKEIETKAGVPLLNAVGTLTFNDLIALTHMASLVVTADTGLMHLAAALDIPQVVIFGAGLVDSCKPLSSTYAIVKHELGCSGCADRCFAPGYPPCLEEVTVPMVFSAVQKILI